MPPRRDSAWRNYATALLRLGAAPVLEIDLSLPLSRSHRDRLDELDLGNGFGVVTAANPEGQLATREANETAHTALERAIVQLGAALVPADGLSPDERHCEHGFAVALPRDRCIALARRFRQLAIYWFDGEAFSIVGVLMETPDVRLPVA